MLFLFIAFLMNTGWGSSNIPVRREFPVNEKIKPCEDFYSYACSKVKEGFQMRPERSVHDFAFADSADRILEFQTTYFSNILKQETMNPYENMLKSYYASCMDLKSRDIEEQAYIRKTIEEIQALSSLENLLKYSEEKMTTPGASLLGFWTESNLYNPDYDDVVLYNPLTYLPERSYYQKDEVFSAYRKLLTSFFQAIKLDQAEKRASDVAGFEKELSLHLPLPEEMRKKFVEDNYISRKELMKKTKSFHLEKFLSKIPNRTKFRDMIPETWTFMEKKLHSLSLEQWKSILLVQALFDDIDVTNSEFFNQKLEFNHLHLGGPKQRYPLPERCSKMASQKMSRELSFVLVDKMFPDFDRERFVRLAQGVRLALLDQLKENTWLSTKAKRAAIKKMSNARMYLVKPVNEIEWNLIPVLSLSGNEFINNTKKIAQVRIDQRLHDLRGKIPPERWGMPPMMVNAYYEPSSNKFVMPIAILQYPFFDKSLSDVEVLGGIGSVIGHELGHGIDDNGSKFDERGRLFSWMTKKDLQEFKKRTNALVDQFNQAGHNGQLTLGENIGDIVGISSAYRAAFPNKSINYSSEDKQKFFLQWARAWCEVQTDSMKEMRLKTDPHSLSIARVNEQMKHQAGFQEAFSCKEGDALFLPLERQIKVW